MSSPMTFLDDTLPTTGYYLLFFYVPMPILLLGSWAIDNFRQCISGGCFHIIRLSMTDSLIHTLTIDDFALTIESLEIDF